MFLNNDEILRVFITVYSVIVLKICIVSCLVLYVCMYKN